MNSRAHRLKIPSRLRRLGRKTEPQKPTPPKRSTSLSPLASLSSESTIDTIRAKIKRLRAAKLPGHFDLELEPFDSFSQRGESVLAELNELIDEVATTYRAVQVLNETAPNHEPVLIFGSECSLLPPGNETPEDVARRESAEIRSKYYKGLADAVEIEGIEDFRTKRGEGTYRRFERYNEDKVIAYNTKLNHKVTSWRDKCERDGCVGFPESPVKVDKQLDWVVGGFRYEQENDILKQELEELRRTFKHH